MSVGAVTTDTAGTCGAISLPWPVILLLASFVLVILILSFFLVHCRHRLNSTRESLVRYICIYLSVKDFVPSDKHPVVNKMKDPVTSKEFIQIINNMLKRMILLPLLLLALLPLPVRGAHGVYGAYGPVDEDTCYVFRFKPGTDTFLVPYRGNGDELKRLGETLARHAAPLREGQLYIGVSSYAASPSRRHSAERMAYLRCSRVKSELIAHHGICERMFVTDRLLPRLYADSLGDVVVVVFPAGVAKVAAIAGEDAAARVSTYIKEVYGDPEAERLAAERAAREREERERQRLAAEQSAAERAEQERLQAEAERQAAETEKERLAAEESVRRQAEADAGPYTFALRANLLRWATLTPDLGVEWRISRNIGILVNGSWTSWLWDNKNRRYAFWKVSPEVRYYIGKERRGYLGVMYHVGEFNYKLEDTGKQGDYQGGGITGGWLLPLNRALSLDFHAALGYTRADYDKYSVADGVRVRTENGVKKNYWGINQLGVTLVWKPF